MDGKIYANAWAALINEVSSVSRLIAYPFQSKDLEMNIKGHVRNYLEAVIEDEWANPRGMLGGSKSKKALDDLSVIFLKAGTKDCRHLCIDPVMRASYAKALDDLRSARE